MITKRMIIAAIPEIFSLRISNYSRFARKTNASEMMRKNWLGVANRLNKAIKTIGNEIEQK